MDNDSEEFDYIVVGAGSAGCVVAGRLGETGRFRTLLLEAGGGDSYPWIDVPMGYAKLYANPRVNWCFQSEPEPELEGRRLFQPRGKVLGGTGSINGMIYMRGQPEDFDGWRELGCTGWSYADVLLYFIKSEHQERGADAFHGTCGPLWVSDLPSRHELADAFIAGAQQLGAPRNDDFNGATQAGTGYVQVTTRKGRRWSTAAGYLALPNVKSSVAVRLHAQARRDPGRKRSRVRRRICHTGRHTHRARTRRGHPLRRRLQFAATDATVGDRPGRTAARNGDPGRAGASGCRRQSARPLRHRGGIPLPQAGDGQRHRQ